MSGFRTSSPSTTMHLSHHRRVVDKCTPRDKYARTHVHLQNSFLSSSDDLSVKTPSPPWVHAYNSRQRSQSSADTQGWKHLPTPIRPTFRPRDYASPPTADDASSESNTNTFKVLHRSLHNLDFDPTCLDRLDEQLLLSPTESFVDVCYSEAIHDETIPVPMLQPIQPRIRKSTRLYDRTAATDEDPFHDWDENYSVKFKKARKKPLPAPPLPELPEASLPRTSHQESMLALLESHILYHNPNESVHFFPVSTQRCSGESRKSSLDAPSIASTSSNGRFRRISDALTGRSRKPTA
ncbi:hypothetical protein CY34DRAFT_619600 [Suillus luteus UH-Slu-Lm8-n1]|uniref:Unplaced genomic scaffold CY34scaffold_58, whole genome shotgun sequence n=1 Tax=Suillus luteus UH-Slu-Lm8-n1 TaxID=930992 RepID=A0A0D0A3H1_9AGAM|nr:hypothetical protein CY34DRAFT_619600 [Suillus luteus UH-Slu-Lm8-n1]